MTLHLLALTLLSLSLQGAPSPAWPQFRDTPALTGVASTTLPANLKVLWTYEAGDTVESSAAIVDGVVYVGAHG